MLVKLYYNTAGVGVAGEEVEVTDELGNSHNSRGECVILRHNPATVGVALFGSQSIERDDDDGKPNA